MLEFGEMTCTSWHGYVPSWHAECSGNTVRASEEVRNEIREQNVMEGIVRTANANVRTGRMIS